jgi:HEAT repeat protein/beta-lactamase regulating signal transducer with metallopeptidase domain
MLSGYGSIAPAATDALTLAGFLLNIWLKAAVLLGVAGLLAMLLKKSAASLRHLVWGIGLSGLLALPILSLLLPPLNVRVLPPVEQASVDSELTATAQPQVPDVQFADESTASFGIKSGMKSAREFAKPRMNAAPEAGCSVSDPVSDPANDTASAPAILELPRRPTKIVLNWRLVLILLWLAGSLVTLCTWMMGAIGARSIVRGSRPVTDQECARDLVELSALLALRRRVRLLEYRDANMPLTCGTIYPTIVLPRGYDEWPSDRRRVVLLHELSHVKRWDCMAQALSQVVCAFYWLNPLVWVAARQLRLESENACDDAVIGSGTKASAYAGHLLEIARNFSLASEPRGALTIARPSQLESRLRSILSPDRRRCPGERLRSVLVSAGLISVGVGLAALSPHARKAGAQVDRVTSGQAITEHSMRKGQAAEGSALEGGDAINIPTVEPAVKAFPGESAAQGQNHTAEPESGTPAPEQKLLQQDRAFIEVQSEENGRGTQSAGGAATQGDDDKKTKGDPRNTAAVEALKGALDDNDPEVRANAMWALSMSGGKISEDALITALRDPNAHVRSQAAWGLGLHGDKKAVEPLISALKDTQPHVRSQAAWALGLKGDNRAVEPLITALKDEQAHVRSQAAWALGLKGDSRAVEPLMAALKDEQAQVKSMAAWALGLKGDARAVDSLKALLKDPSDYVRRQATWALGMLLMKSGGGDGNEDEQESDNEEGAVRHFHWRGRGNVAAGMRRAN